MEQVMIHVLIADDEQIVRSGLKCIIDWEQAGFSICGEAGDGEEALEKIRQLQPELVLMDIRMPKLSGLELIEKIRAEGYEGEFIILSGYSDFSYAQTAIRSGVAYYLTKPIDENELEAALKELRVRILQKKDRTKSLEQYRAKAKPAVLADLFTGSEFNPSLNYSEMDLVFPVYQIALYEWYSRDYHSYGFLELLSAGSRKENSFEHLTVEEHHAILLKGDSALQRFRRILSHYEEGPQKGSPLDGIFLVYGPPIAHLEQIRSSYQICTALISRRFFCDENQHVLSYDMLPQGTENPALLNSESSMTCSNALINYIQSYNRRQISETLDALRTYLYNSGEDIRRIKYYLADIFFEVKAAVAGRYKNVTIPFDANAAILELIENKQYLYEILRYFSEQFEMVIRCIGNNSADSVFDDILHYIAHNYFQPLKLETIAPLFGYNSSYLGKLFTQKTGVSFNTYLDTLRIREATKLLDTTGLKVYEIASQIGYRNVDYFHQKFRKQMNMSPAEYRNRTKG